MTEPTTLHLVGGPKDGEALQWPSDLRELRVPIFREMGMILSPVPGEPPPPVDHLVYRSHDHPLMIHNELARAFRSKARVFRRPDSPAARRATREGRPRSEEIDVQPQVHTGTFGHRSLFFSGIE